MQNNTSQSNAIQEFCLIPLSGKAGQGLFIKVSPHRYDELNRFRWQYVKGYVRRDTTVKGKPTMILIHRFITQCPDGLEVDHKNGDKLDNTDGNLRIATRPQNCANRKKTKIGSSKYMGVYWDYSLDRWVAKLGHKGRRIHLGVFESEDEAARVRDGAALALNGEFAALTAPHLTPIPYIHKNSRTPSSKYRGVGWHNRIQKWSANFPIAKGRKGHIGYFESEIEAAKARDAKIIEMGLVSLKLNFPDK